MASAPTFQFPLRVEAVGADPDGPEVAEEFVLDLRRELAEVDVTRVERVPGGPAPEGARALELIAVFELVITAVQAGEALTKAQRYSILYRVQDAKRPETRARRIADFVTMLGEGRQP